MYPLREAQMAVLVLEIVHLSVMLLYLTFIFTDSLVE